MPVQCIKCGEMLLGAVNRCWKCGSEFTPNRDDPEIPPVRRSPIDFGLVVAKFQGSLMLAEVVNNDATQNEAGRNDDVRRGSPFADVASPTTARTQVFRPTTNSRRAPTPTQYPQHTSSIGGAIGGIVLGVFSVVAIFMSSVGALVTSILGIGLGLWGLYSNQRGFAIVGLVLCFLILSLAGFFTAVSLYETFHGHSPFERILPESDDLPISVTDNGLGIRLPLIEEQRWHAFG